jgi:hypothetical protein
MNQKYVTGYSVNQRDTDNLLSLLDFHSREAIGQHFDHARLSGYISTGNAVFIPALAAISVGVSPHI